MKTPTSIRLISIWLMLLTATMAQRQTPVLSCYGGSNVPTVTLPNIQLQSSSLWTTQGGSCCGGSTTGTNTSTWGNASPSLSGKSLMLQSSGASYNVQYFYEAPCASLPGGNCIGFTHLYATAYTYVPSSSAVPHGIEGPNVVIYQGTYELYPSLQCATNVNSTTPSVPTWNLYSMQAVSGDTWVPQNISCASYLASTNTWHRIDVDYYLNFAGGGTMSYGSLYLDNVLIANFAGGTSSTGRSFTGAQHMRPQYQLDAASGAGLTTLYVDNYSVTVQ